MHSHNCLSHFDTILVSFPRVTYNEKKFYSWNSEPHIAAKGIGLVTPQHPVHLQ